MWLYNKILKRLFRTLDGVVVVGRYNCNVFKRRYNCNVFRYNS